MYTGVCILSVPQTDTGEWVEKTQAYGWGWFKELGKKAERKLCDMLCHNLLWLQQKFVNRLFSKNTGSCKPQKGKYRSWNLSGTGKSTIGVDCNVLKKYCRRCWQRKQERVLSFFIYLFIRLAKEIEQLNFTFCLSDYRNCFKKV